RGVDAVLAKLSGSSRGDVLVALIAPRQNGGRKRPPVDLLLSVAPTVAPLGKIESTLDRLLTRELLVSPAGRTLHEQLAQPGTEFPGDVRVQTLAAIAALRRGDASAARTVVENLATLVADSPLEPIASGGRPNARQRRHAAQQIGLWLVARQCVQ